MVKGLQLEYKTLNDKIALLKEKQSTLHEHEKSHVNNLIKENEVLKKKNNELNEIVLKFTNGQKNLEILLSSKTYVFDKGGRGYKPNLKQKYCNNYFVKATTTRDHKILCHYCNRNGHLSYACLIKKNAYFGIKAI